MSWTQVVKIVLKIEPQSENKHYLFKRNNNKEGQLSDIFHNGLIIMLFDRVKQPDFDY